MAGKAAKEREQYLRLEGGVLVEFTREIYRCYYSCARRERYQKERDWKNRVVSMEMLMEASVRDGGKSDGIFTDGRDIAEEVAKQMLLEELAEAIRLIRPGEKELIVALFYRDMSMREYGDYCGISYQAVQSRRNRVLNKLYRYLCGEKKGF